MSYYDAFMSSSLNPKEQILLEEQEIINYHFDMASTIQTDVYVEEEFGTLVFKKIQARVTHLIDAKSGLRVSDDFKKIIFKDCKYKPRIGVRYQFEDNIWMAFDSDSIKSSTSAIYVRRCNQTLNIQDRYGNIHKEPCYVEYKPTKTSVSEYDTLSIPYTKQQMYCQYNNWTKNIKQNTRVLFGERAYKISDSSNFNRLKTFDNKSIAVIQYRLDDDLINEADNFELQIADYRDFDYKIKTEKEVSLQIEQIGNLEALVYFEDEAQADEPLVWESSNSEVLEIDASTGEYHSIAEGQATVIVSMENAPQYKTEISVFVVNSIIPVFENRFTPNETYLPIGSTKTYEIREYKNGELQDTEFEIEDSGMLQSYYSFTKTLNSFTITSKKMNSKNLLRVDCRNLRDNSIATIYIELGGL